MARKHNHHGSTVRHERRTDRLQLRADQFGRRSARGFGVIVSLARMVERRVIIATAELPESIRRVGQVGLSADAYAVDFNGVILIAVYDRRGQSIAAFLPLDALEIIPG